MSSCNPFDARARRTCLNHAVAKFHRRLTSLAYEIDADLAERGFGGLSSHPKIADAFRSLGIVVDEALAFEEQAAEFQRQRLRDTGEFDQVGAWTEEDGKQLWERLRQELEQLPERLYSQAKRLFRPQGIVPRFRGTATVTAEELSYRVAQAFAEGRARMRLAVEQQTRGSEGNGGMPSNRSCKGKGGKPPLSEAEATKRLTILQEWWRAQEAGVKQKDFCRDKGIKVGTLQRYVNWHGTRKTRNTN